MCFVDDNYAGFLANDLEFFGCHLAASAACGSMQFLDARDYDTAFQRDRIPLAPQATDRERTPEVLATVAQVEPHLSERLNRLLAELITMRNPQNDLRLWLRLPPGQQCFDGGPRFACSSGKRENGTVVVLTSIKDLG